MKKQNTTLACGSAECYHVQHLYLSDMSLNSCHAMCVMSVTKTGISHLYIVSINFPNNPACHLLFAFHLHSLPALNQVLPKRSFRLRLYWKCCTILHFCCIISHMCICIYIKFEGRFAKYLHLLYASWGFFNYSLVLKCAPVKISEYIIIYNGAGARNKFSQTCATKKNQGFAF